MSLRKVIAQIKRHNNFLITSHTNLEGDAIGSELGFSKLVRAMGKSAVIVNEDNIPADYEFLPRAEEVVKYKDNLKNIKFDCFVCLDCSDLRRSGEVYRMNKGGKCILNIDHHISNEEFGHFNWVDPKASSCSEMIYVLFKKMNVKLDNESALALYTGILTDTGSFRYSNTTSVTHRITGELLKFGIDVNGVYRNVYGNIPFRDMRLIINSLNKVKRKAGGKIMWFEIKASVLKKYKDLYVDLTDHLLGFARATKETEVALLFRENLGVKNQVRVNLRSQGKVDVNKIAKAFGGGGHKTASGCTLNGTLAAVRSKVLKKVEESLPS